MSETGSNFPGQSTANGTCLRCKKGCHVYGSRWCADCWHPGIDEEYNAFQSTLKERTGIECANCESCVYLGSESDGNYPEFAISWPVCRKFERYQYLKPFPFKTEQKCWEPDFWASKFAEKIDGSDESVLSAIDDFKQAITYT